MKHTLIALCVTNSLLLAGGDISSPANNETQDMTPSIKKAWDYELEVYMFMSAIDGDTAFGNLSGDVSMKFFDDTIPNLKLGGMAHFEAHHESGWGYWLDYGFMNLGKSDDVSIIGIHANTDVGLFQGVLEGALLYRTSLPQGYLDYYAGFRWWDNDYDVAIKVGNIIDNSKSRSEDWVDGFVGARWTRKLNENWSFRTKADIGAGGSDFTASASLGFLYAISSSLELDIRYQSLWVDYETGTKGTQSYYTYDTVTYGPLVGLTFRF